MSVLLNAVAATMSGVNSLDGAKGCDVPISPGFVNLIIIIGMITFIFYELYNYIKKNNKKGGLI